MVKDCSEIFSCNICECLHGDIIPGALKPAMYLLAHFQLIGPVAEGSGILDGLARWGSSDGSPSPHGATARATGGGVSQINVRKHIRNSEGKGIVDLKKAKHSGKVVWLELCAKLRSRKYWGQRQRPQLTTKYALTTLGSCIVGCSPNEHEINECRNVEVKKNNEWPLTCVECSTSRTYLFKGVLPCFVVLCNKGFMFCDRIIECLGFVAGGC